MLVGAPAPSAIVAAPAPHELGAVGLAVGVEEDVIVDEQAWDGSDFFKITEYPFILLTQKVKDFIVERGLTNCALIPTQDLVWDKFVIKPEDIYGNSQDGQDR